MKETKEEEGTEEEEAGTGRKRREELGTGGSRKRREGHCACSRTKTRILKDY